jgi:hypothetical protein
MATTRKSLKLRLAAVVVGGLASGGAAARGSVERRGLGRRAALRGPAVVVPPEEGPRVAQGRNHPSPPRVLVAGGAPTGGNKYPFLVRFLLGPCPNSTSVYEVSGTVRHPL